jgi:hypothetical protein
MTSIGLIDKLGDRSIFLIISIIIVAIIIDTSIVKISTFTGGLSPQGYYYVAIFAVMTLIFGVGQYFILRLAKRKYKENTVSQKLKLNTIDKIVRLIQYLLLAILVSVIIQMLLTASYNIFSLLAVVWITYALAMVMLGLVSQRFIFWFKSNHNSVVLLYALVTLMLLINAGVTVLYMTGEFQNDPMIIRPIRSLTGAFSSAETTLSSLYFMTFILSFILTWIATVILLKHYSRKLGTAKYWIIVSIPLVYFLSQFQPLFLDVLTPFRLSDPILFGIVYTLIFGATKPAGGILFGVAFWSIARNLRRSAVKDYMLISAYGMMLLFISNQPIGLLLVPYPPFGLATISFMGLASYLILVGIYSAAISVSEDIKLRQSIRKIAIKESKLLDSIGSAEMEQQIEKKVMVSTKAAQRSMINESGIEPSLSEEDMKQYLDIVLDEIKSTKEKRSRV